MADPKRSTSMPVLAKVLTFRTQSLSPPPSRGVSNNIKTFSSMPTKLSSKLSPKMLKGLAGFVAPEKKRRSVRPIYNNSVNSSITCTDFDDVSALMMNDGSDGCSNDPLALQKTTMRRAVSMDSDSKPLRPFRRSSNAPSKDYSYLMSECKEPPLQSNDYGVGTPWCSKDSVSASVTSSITFADFQQDFCGLLGGDFPPPPLNMRRAVSMDSDSKPLRPLRRESQFSSQTDYHQNDYPEPTSNKRDMSMDSLPNFPSRRDSMALDSSLSSHDESKSSCSSRGSSSMDSQPRAPGRKTSITGFPHVKRRSASSSDRQPSVPGRKTSMSHSVCMDVCQEEGEEDVEEEMENNATQSKDRRLGSGDATKRMSITSAVA